MLTFVNGEAPSKEANLEGDPEALAKQLPRELLHEWSRTRPQEPTRLQNLIGLF